MPLNVYLSVGRTSTPQQEQFVQLIEEYLKNQDLTPRTLGRSVFRNQQSLKSIKELMEGCAGTIIIAFERTYIEQGLDQRGSSHQAQLLDAKLPTAWNQVEAGMTYVLGQPLFVLAEMGLRKEALLKDGFDWHVTEVRLDRSALSDPVFLQVFADWKKLVGEYQVKRQSSAQITPPKVDPGTLTAIEIFKALTAAQLWAIITALFAIIGAVAVASYNLGAILAPK